MQTYDVYRIRAVAELRELLIAFLARAGFDSFEETEAGLDAYGTTDRREEFAGVLDELGHQFDFTYERTALEPRNWNEVWESQFTPIRIDDKLLIRASFHPSEPGFAQELVIDPRMAFGTGHHETTYMMCELLLGGAVAGGRVFDYGSGTGVLAILAKRLGASYVDAVDIEEPSVENTRENAELNGVVLDQIVLGTLDDVPVGPPYDLILANINRNVILATAGALYERLAKGGSVFFSGVLAQDEPLVVSRLTELGYRHRETRARGDWRALVVSR